LLSYTIFIAKALSTATTPSAITRQTIELIGIVSHSLTITIEVWVFHGSHITFTNPTFKCVSSTTTIEGVIFCAIIACFKQINTQINVIWLNCFNNNLIRNRFFSCASFQVTFRFKNVLIEPQGKLLSIIFERSLIFIL